MPVWARNDPFSALGGPTSKAAPVDSEGTSFAAPYAASVAALMIKANPKITPDQIENILTSPGVARHIPNQTRPGWPHEPPRDGAGEIDPVAAVAAARGLATAGN
jgi:serine protease